MAGRPPTLTCILLCTAILTQHFIQSGTGSCTVWQVGTMESKQLGEYYYEAMAEPHTGIGTGRAQRTARHPVPKRGRIKKAIFAEILDAMKRSGTTLAEILDALKRIGTKMAASAGKICNPGKATSTAAAIDLLLALRP